jgi:cation-transporting ATPase 13A2
MVPLQDLTYRYPISTVFPLSFETAANGASSDSRPLPSPIPKQNGAAALEDTMLENLRFLDYRYSRFALDPRTSLFRMLTYVPSLCVRSFMLLFDDTRSDWRDPSWTGVSAVQHGLRDNTRHQRFILFGRNGIDIQEKSIISLLIDEVRPLFWKNVALLTILEQIIHPFYVFQVASVILWSIDDYYYYALCIAFISTLSITTTLIDTKKVRPRSVC